MDEQTGRSLRAELVDLVGRLAAADGPTHLSPTLMVRRQSEPTRVGHGTSHPTFCVIAQGAKELRIGSRALEYDPSRFLISSASLPIASRVSQASPEHPYLGVVLHLEPALVGDVIATSGIERGPTGAAESAIAVGDLDLALLECVVRLVRLAEHPDDAPYLSPLVMREIVYRLLQSDQAGRVWQIASVGGPGSRIFEAISRLRTTYDEPVRIDELASDLGMSVSGFHHHFKHVTAMSPLQFQKHIRLQEARRLLVSGEADARQAGYRVGYDDASHFSRDYRRYFGEPPMRDVQRLREAPMVVAEQ